MKSIERRFKKIQAKHEGWSSYLCFVEAVKGQKFNKDAIRRWFNKLVEKDDYYPSDKRAVIAHVQALTEAVTTPRNGGKSRA